MLPIAKIHAALPPLRERRGYFPALFLEEPWESFRVCYRSEEGHPMGAHLALARASVVTNAHDDTRSPSGGKTAAGMGVMPDGRQYTQPLFQRKSWSVYQHPRSQGGPSLQETDD
jgi:hypothetical protein